MEHLQPQTRWFAPMTHRRRGFLQYANIYCKQCNEVFVPNEQDDICSLPRFQKAPTGGVFDMLIDYRKVSALMDEQFHGTGKPSEDGRCGKGMAKHISKVLYLNKFQTQKVRCIQEINFFFFLMFLNCLHGE